MQSRRVVLGLASFVVLLVLTVLVMHRHASDGASDDGVRRTLPEVDRGALTELEIQAKDKPVVVLKKVDAKVWRMEKPVVADADQSAVDRALEKLADLDVAAVAATRKELHNELEVAEGQGTRVVARAGSKVVADLVFGAYRGSATMVRPHGEDRVLSVRGSLSWLFARDVKDWRDKVITEVEPESISELSFVNKNGKFAFQKSGSDWKATLQEPKLKGFDSAKVASMVSTVARLRATDFAPQGVQPAQAGLEGADVAEVRIVRTAQRKAEGGAGGAMGGSGGALGSAPVNETLVLRIGAKAPAQEALVYVQKVGNPTLYLVGEFNAKRLVPDASAFAPDPPPAKEGDPANAAGAVKKPLGKAALP